MCVHACMRVFACHSVHPNVYCPLYACVHPCMYMHVCEHMCLCVCIHVLSMCVFMDNNCFLESLYASLC